MRARPFARFALIATVAAALACAAAPEAVLARPSEPATTAATAESLSAALLAAARDAAASAQAQGLAPMAATRVVEAAIFGVISKSGAGYSTLLAALRLARLSSADPVTQSAILAALSQVEGASRSGCSSCGVTLTTGLGPTAGGGGTPAYSRRGLP